MSKMPTLGLLGFLAWAALQPFAAYAQTPCCSAPVGTNSATCAVSKSCFKLTQTTWLTLSGEYRARYETLDPQDFGISGGVVSNSIANRALLGAELRDGSGLRAVFQLSAAGQDSRAPVPRSFDESAIDIAQAYVDLPLKIGAANLIVRLGRQELALGNRLVSLRDGVILRRAFDGVRLDVDVDGQKVIALHASPVQNKPDAFDDKPIEGEQFNALIWQSSHPITSGRWSAYFLDRERNLGRYVQVSGAERRQNYGLQFSKRTQTFDLTAQGSLQFGQVAEADVAAFGFSLDMGWTTGSLNPLRYGLQVGYASGDDDAGDGKLNTFDPVYPNLGAFTDAPLYFYANQFNVQASVNKTMGDLILRSEVTMLGRPTNNDAIFSSSGRPLLASLQTPRLSAVAFDVSARWRLASNMELYASALHARALDGVTKAGGRDTNFFLLQLTTGF